MALAFERYLHLNSPLHRWQPTHKLMGLSALIFAFAFLEDLRLIPAMLIMTLALYGLSRLPLSLLLHHLRYPSLFILGVVALLPFCTGDTVIGQWGSLSLRAEGLSQAVLIVSRFGAILTLGVILLGTCPFAQTIKAMRALGLPLVLADMILLSYRYLFEFAHMLTTMQQSMRLRGFRHRLSWPWQQRQGQMRHYAGLTGTLLVRSYEQAQRSYQAMSLRGYGQPLPSRTQVQAKQPDWWGRMALILMLAVAGGFIITDLL